jgi:uncharacterized membrane protein YphA (DoxX/SURF4 family)
MNIIRIILSIIFLLSGGAKLASLQFEILAFERWGYPLWFMYFIGAVEVAGGICLMLNWLAALASAGLAAMMVGALVTHIKFNEWGMLAVATTILIMLAFFAVRNNQDIFKFFKK